MAAHYHSTLPHCPWSNDTVEQTNRDTQQAFRALISEYRLLPRQWLLLKPVVQMSINYTLATTLGGKAPITVFTGLLASHPLDIVFLPPKASSETRLTAERIAELPENLRTSLQAIHKNIVSMRSPDDVDDVGLDANDVRPPKGADVNLDVGDLSPHISNTKITPCEVVWSYRSGRRCTPWIKELEELLDGTKHKAHTRRLTYYIDDVPVDVASMTTPIETAYPTCDISK